MIMECFHFYSTVPLSWKSFLRLVGVLSKSEYSNSFNLKFKILDLISFEDEELNLKFTQAKSFIADKVVALKSGKIEIEFARVCYNESLNKYISLNVFVNSL